MLAPDRSPTLQCPHCKTEIRLTESLAAPLIEAARAELEQHAAERERQVAERETALQGRVRELEAQRGQLDEEVSTRLRGERAALVATEAKKAREALAHELERGREDLAARDALLKDRDAKLSEARKKELELLQAQRALEEQKESLALDVERRLQEERGKLREEVRKSADEENRLRLAEKDKLISDMQRQVEELRRKSEQGSQQMQGEVLELELEAQLRGLFPLDPIEPVPKGEHGGDVVQRVIGPNGQVVGSILWEVKRTKAWSEPWLAKLRDDQRAAKAELAILVSQTLPPSIESFGVRDEVWVTSQKTAMPLALCLRQLVLDVAAARQSGEGLETKMGLVYKYFSGPRFRQRVQAIIESFSTMREDLDKERKAITKQWAKREAQLDRALRASAGMYGDLQGIAGKTLQEIDLLEFKQLEAPFPEPEEPDA